MPTRVSRDLDLLTIKKEACAPWVDRSIWASVWPRISRKLGHSPELDQFRSLKVDQA